MKKKISKTLVLALAFTSLAVPSYAEDSYAVEVSDNLIGDYTVEELEGTINDFTVQESEGLVQATGKKFTLSATLNSQSDILTLNWDSLGNKKKYLYQVYEQCEGDEEGTYQSIGVLREIKVLEIYSVESTLKEYVEKYGQTKIKCDAMSVAEFNVDPSVIWNYDVIVIGEDEQDLTTQSQSKVEKYIDEGNVVLNFKASHMNGNNSEEKEENLTYLINKILHVAKSMEDTSLDVHRQDLIGPTTPTIINSNVNFSNGTATLELASEDQGNTYKYYVEGVDTSKDRVYQSNVVSIALTSGLKGYSIVVDNNPETIPDDTIETDTNHYVIAFDKTKPTYIHIKAIDNVGNVSNVLHHEIKDLIPPTMPSVEKVNDTLKLVPGVDRESGVAKHEYRLNDGEWQTWESDMDLKALEDGKYTLEVKAIDYAGNESEIYKVDFKITYKQVAEATKAVEKVEENFTVEDYKHAKELVDALDEGDIKDALKERLDKVAEMHSDELLLDEMEEIKEKLSDESTSDKEFKEVAQHFEKIKDKVNTVTDEAIKERIEELIDEIEEIIANKKYHLTEETFDLTVTPKPEDNNVDLDWTPATDDPLLDYTYRIYSQKNDGSFQSIPAIDTVKVLEIHPNQSHLKRWVREYDTIGKISCSTISIEDFMTKPEVAWKYDVIVFGFDDSYMGKDLDEASTEVVRQFIEAGKGVLFSHDTLATFIPKPNLRSLASYLNLETIGGDKYKVQTEAYIAQTGGIVNYPYMVGKLGDGLTLPSTHPLYQVPSGDVWVRYDLDNQFYLTTWNNCAMIQTGHKPAETNESEQRLLLNTIYYLAQITDQTSWNDYMGQDVDKPTTPELSNIQTETPNSELSLDMLSEDQGTSYNYYVEATCVQDNTKISTTTKSALMISGLQGYSIAIDEEEGTIPDDEIETTENSYAVLADFTKPFYVHVKAIDNVGNSSDTVHYYYTDTLPPTMPSLVMEEDVLKLIPGEDYGFGIDKQLYSVNDSEWQEWRGDINLLELEDGEYTFIVKATDKAQHESESYTYVINITCHQDAVDTAQKLDACKLVFEDETVTEEELENTLAEFEELKSEARRLASIDSSLLEKVAEIEEILIQREAKAEEDAPVIEDIAEAEKVPVTEETTEAEKAPVTEETTETEKAPVTEDTKEGEENTWWVNNEKGWVNNEVGWVDNQTGWKNNEVAGEN